MHSHKMQSEKNRPFFEKGSIQKQHRKERGMGDFPNIYRGGRSSDFLSGHIFRLFEFSRNFLIEISSPKLRSRYSKLRR